MVRAELMQRILWVGLTSLAAGMLAVDAVSAQVRPDGTLGGEASRVRAIRIRDRDNVVRDIDLIEGGARRSGNLFHSFEQFDVPEGRGAYFGNPADVRNIFSRVTSADRSEIFGTLGVLGDANLYFMNPNGILFGPNASLDIQGSFVGTTANAIQFGDQGFFGVTDQSAPSLLTVNPSAFLFNQIPTGNIVNLSTEGLASGTGSSVLLLGGDVIFDRGSLVTSGGFINVGGLSGTGVVSLTDSATQLSLAFPADAPRADITLTNGGAIGAFRGGGIRLQGRNLQINNQALLAASTGSTVNSRGIQLQATGNIGISNSRIISGVGTSATGLGGDIDINADNLAVQNATVSATTQGDGSAGSVNIQVANTVSLDAGRILSDPQLGSSGSGGNVTLQTSQLLANNRSLISASTFAAGNAGNVVIRGDRIDLANNSLVTTQTRGTGSAGDIYVNAQNLQLRTGAQFAASSFGGSNAGNLFVNADQINITGFSNTGLSSGLLSVIDADAIGEGGDIAINAGQVQVENGGLISTASLGQGNAGNIDIRAQRVNVDEGVIEASTGTLTNFFVDDVQAAAVGDGGNVTIRANQLDLNYGFIRAQVGEQARGDAGNILLDVQELQILEGAQVSTATYGNGNAGNLGIQADQITISGALDNNPSGLFSLVETTGNGQGGNISIQANQIRVEDNATITASTLGNGNAGELDIQADRLLVDNGSIEASIQRRAMGNGGNIRIVANQLQLQNDGTIIASTRGRGNAGNIAVQARTIDLDNGGIGSQVLEDVNTSGNSGNITINTQQLNLRNGAQIDTSTFANGSAGNITIQANQIELTGRNTAINSAVAADGQGQGGNLRFNVDQLNLSDQANISTISQGRGNAGTITLRGQQLDMQTDSSINASTLGVGRSGDILLDVDQIQINDSSIINSVGAVNQSGGSITLRTDDLTLNNESLIAAQVVGSGDGGEIIIDADRMAFNDSVVSTAVGEGATGNAGNITLRGQQLSLRNGAQVSPSLFGNGNAGNLFVQVDDIAIVGRNADGDSSFSSNVEENGNGRAGDIQVEADRVRLAGTANISASVEGVGQAGDISVQADQIILDLGFIRSQVRRQAREGTAGDIAVETEQLNLINGGQISTGSFTRGDAGDITIRAERINITGANPANGQPSGVFSIIETEGQGQSGNIEIATNRLQIRDGIITASTRGVGDAGNLSIIADRLQMSGGLIATTVEQGASGNGGRLTVRGERLSLSNGGQFATTTSGNGNAGTLLIEADRIDLAGARRVQLDSGARGISPSGFASSVQEGGEGRGGNLRVETNQLRVRNGARITAATSGNGNAGNVVILAQDAIVLNGTNRLGLSSEIASSNTIGSQGRGGTITLRTGMLRIAEGAVVNARTANANRGGNVMIYANLLESLNGGQIVTTTLREGQAGNITLNVRDRINLAGQDANFRQRQIEAGAQFLPNEGQGESGFFANSRADSTGSGGTINLNTTNLDLSDHARISAQSQGTGEAGGITIQSRGNATLSNRARISTESQGENAPAGNIQIETGNTFTATDSDVTTSAANASGGDIRLTASDIRLFGDSDIRTNSARNGGNITLGADTIVAFDDSDIFASAAQGRGGDITLNTSAFFGDNYQPDASENGEVSELENNNQVDLNATGTVSSGTISTPNTSFIQNSLSDLPDGAINTDDLLANSCISRDQQTGTFLITGSGSLPTAPGNNSTSTYPTGEVRPIPEGERSRWQSGDPIVEPQGVYRLPDGRLVMSRECEASH